MGPSCIPVDNSNDKIPYWGRNDLSTMSLLNEQSICPDKSKDIG